MSEERQILFPLLYAFEGNHEEMFLYFLNEYYYLWKDDLLVYLIKIMLKSKQDLSVLVKYLQHILNSENLLASFHQMSFHYRSQFVENLINLIETVTEQ